MQPFSPSAAILVSLLEAACSAQTRKRINEPGLTPHIILRLLFVGCALLIIFASLVPAPPGISIENADKAGHYLAYTSLALLACLAFPVRSQQILALVFSLSLGFLLEGIQATLPSRDMSLLDALANSLGVLSGVILYHVQGSILRKWLRLEKG